MLCMSLRTYLTPICSFSPLLAAPGSVEITNRDEERGQLCQEFPSVGSGCVTAVNSNGNCSLNRQMIICHMHPNRKPVGCCLKKIGFSVKSLSAAKWRLEKVCLFLSFCTKIEVSDAA